MTVRSAACSGSTPGLWPRGHGPRSQPRLQPQGPSLPPAQDKLEADLQARAGQALRHRVQPPLCAGQHAHPALRQHADQQGRVPQLSAAAEGRHRPENLDTVMCRSLVSVDYQGDLYDCDFSQMLALPAARRHPRAARPTTQATPSAWRSTAMAARPGKAPAAAARWRPDDEAAARHRGSAAGGVAAIETFRGWRICSAWRPSRPGKRRCGRAWQPSRWPPTSSSSPSTWQRRLSLPGAVVLTLAGGALFGFAHGGAGVGGLDARRCSPSWLRALCAARCRAAPLW